jgi:hypothetical protein
MMHAGQCRTMQEVLSICSLGAGLFQEPHSDTLCGWQDSVRGLALDEAIVHASPCVRMLGFLPRSERATKEAGLQSNSRHIRWVQHIDYVVLLIRSIG